MGAMWRVGFPLLLLQESFFLLKNSRSRWHPPRATTVSSDAETKCLVSKHAHRHPLVRPYEDAFQWNGTTGGVRRWFVVFESVFAVLARLPSRAWKPFSGRIGSIRRGQTCIPGKKIPQSRQ